METQSTVKSNVHYMIHDSIEKDDLGRLKILLKHASVGVIKEKATDGLTPLLRACIHGSTKMVRYLLEKGAAIDDTDGGGNTCLHYASRKEDTDLVQLLLRSCARTFIRNNDGLLAIDLAAEATCAELISNKMMKDGPSEFVAACQRMNLSGKLCNKKLVMLKDREIAAGQTRRVSLPTYLT
eukprot:gene3603-4111_t